MKNQYFGDIGDYGKYSLLRAFAKEGIKIGVNWYLTGDDGGSDGKHTGYLQKGKDRIRDPELFDCLKQMVDSKNRDIKAFESKNMIPGAVYYHEPLDITRFDGIKAKRAERDRWHNGAMKKLKDAELVFLDPDNGMKTNNNSTGKNSIKYAFTSEALDYYNRGQNIVYYCHKGRRTEYQWEEAKKAMFDHMPEAVLIALTLHRGTQRTFMFALHKDSRERYAEIVKTFIESKWGECFEIEPVGGTYLGMGTGFAAPAIGTIYPKGSVVKKNEDGTVTIVPPEGFDFEYNTDGTITLAPRNEGAKKN